MTKKKALIVTAFVLYAVLMLWMMIFGRIGTVHFDTYAEYLSSHISFIPLRFIADYVKSAKASGFYNIEMRNIIGNTVLFAPLGMFLPCLFSKLGKYGKFILAVAAIITAVELLQLFCALGSFDIDDILLNCLGASAGFVLYSKIISKK